MSLEKPQPSSSKRWKALIAVSIAALLGFLALKTYKGKPAKQAGGERSTTVATTPVKSGELQVKLHALGTVIPTEVVTVKTRVDGYITKVAYQEGQLVKKGQVLVEIDSRPYTIQLKQAEGQLTKDRANLKNAELDLKRIQTLRDERIVSQQMLDTQSATVDQLKAAIQTDQALVMNAKLNLNYSHITAPLSGKIGLRLVDVGNVARAADATGLAVITPLDPITVVFTLPADQIPLVMGREHIAVEALDRDGSKVLAKGIIKATDNQIDAATGTLKVRALFENAKNTLFPNQFVNVSVLVDTLKNTLLVPTVALQTSPKGTFVYVNKDGEAAMQPVEIATTQGDTTALKEGGLQEGTQVIVEGLDKLRPGSKVRLGKEEGGGGGGGRQRREGKHKPSPAQGV